MSRSEIADVPGVWATPTAEVRRDDVVLAMLMTFVGGLRISISVVGGEPAAWRWIALLSTMTTDLSGGIVSDLLLRDPVKRTAAVLLRVAGVRSNVFVLPEPSPIHLSQERLAHLVNLSRNSVIPILHEFVRLGFIEVKYGSIAIIDAKGLSSTISG